MNRDYHAATDWRAPKPIGAHAGDRPCALCDRPTGQCADCTLPAVPGDGRTGPLPGGEAWFVPICPACFQARAPEGAGARAAGDPPA
jgi:hypothetical protein